VAGVFMPKIYMQIYLLSRKKRDGFLRGRNLSYGRAGKLGDILGVVVI